MIRARKKEGFTLIELLVQITIFAVIAAFLIGITLVAFRVKNRSVADTEVLGQLNFAMQTIQRLVREATDADVIPNEKRLILTMSDPLRDPTIITRTANDLTLKEGSGSPTNLTNDQVTVDDLDFALVTNTGAPDTVQIQITLSYKTNNPFSEAVRTLRSSASLLY